MKMTTKVLTAHVPLHLADKVDKMAARLGRSRGWVIQQALVAWIAQEEERDRLTYEALADVDAGRSIEHQAVKYRGRLNHCSQFGFGIPLIRLRRLLGHNKSLGSKLLLPII